jgi:hypothetical protein
MTGGYGVDTATGQFSTKDALTAIFVPGLMHWVEEIVANEAAAQYIRHIFDPIFQVTGGYMTRASRNMTLLIFGQNFEGFYVPSASGVYTRQVRRFRIIDDGVTLRFLRRRTSDGTQILPGAVILSRGPCSRRRACSECQCRVDRSREGPRPSGNFGGRPASAVPSPRRSRRDRSPWPSRRPEPT